MTTPMSPRKHEEEAWRRQAQKCIAHVDLDAFYAQVEVKNDPTLRGKPVGVVQYNPYGDLATLRPRDHRIFNDSNGSLIAVSYEARDFGVKRNMRGDEARKVCPDLQLVQVPTAHGKADLTHYRSSGSQVTDILARLAVCEKASIDECYLDISEEARRRMKLGPPALPVNPDRVHICGQESALAEDWYTREAGDWGSGEQLLACGASAVADLRAAVKAELGFSCSAGIAHCKLLAKLASGLHKPSQQTLVPAAAVPGLLSDLPVPKLRQLGGKFGEEVMQQLNIQTVGELAAVPKARLDTIFGEEKAQRLFNLSHGIDDDEVKQRTLPKSISCGKTFQGFHALRSLPDVHKWLTQLGQELEERVAVDRQENAREPTHLSVHAGKISRSGPLRRATADVIAEDALALLKKWTSVTPGWTIQGMSVCVTKFVPASKATISRFVGAPSNGDALVAQPPGETGAGVPNPTRTTSPAGRTIKDIFTRKGPAANPSRLPATASNVAPQFASPTGKAVAPQLGAPSGTAETPWSAGVPPGGAAENLGNPGTPANAAGSMGYTQLQAAGRSSSSGLAQRAVANRNAPWRASAAVTGNDESDEGGRRAKRQRVDGVEGASLGETEAPGAEGAGGTEAGSSRGKPREGEGPVEGVDPEIWAALPPDIQRELRLTAMANMGRGGQGVGAGVQQGTAGKLQRAPPKRGKGAIASFFAKR